MLFFTTGKTSAAEMSIAENDVQQGRQWIDSLMVSTIPSTPMIVPYSKEINTLSCQSLQAQNEARAWQNSPMFACAATTSKLPITRYGKSQIVLIIHITIHIILYAVY